MSALTGTSVGKTELSLIAVVMFEWVRKEGDGVRLEARVEVDTGRFMRGGTLVRGTLVVDGNVGVGPLLARILGACSAFGSGTKVGVIWIGATGVASLLSLAERCALDMGDEEKKCEY
jgi:hypothetical protein